MPYKHRRREQRRQTLMYKIIGADQKEYGPVTADQLREWITQGRAHGQTAVLAEGAREWKPLATCPEFAEVLTGSTGRLPKAGGTSPPANLAVWTTEVLARQPVVQIGRCLSRAGTLLKANFGLLFGATAVVWLISLCQLNPFVGIIYWVLSGPLHGGLYRIFLKRIRGQPAAIGEVFEGFKQGFAQLMLAGVISSLLSAIGMCFCVLPGIYLMIAWVFAVPLVADQHLEFWSALELSRKAATRVWFEMLGLLLLAFLPLILVDIFVGIKTSLTVFSSLQGLLGTGQLDIERIVHAFAQIPKSNYLFGLLTKLVLLLNLPFALGALMVAYEDIFGARPAETA
jgi:uncharacterized membrane protein